MRNLVLVKSEVLRQTLSQNHIQLCRSLRLPIGGRLRGGCGLPPVDDVEAATPSGSAGHSDHETRQGTTATVSMKGQECVPTTTVGGMTSDSLAASVTAQLRAIFHVDGDFSELEADSKPDYDWARHLSSVDDDEPGTVSVTLDSSDPTDVLTHNAARSVLTLTGDDHPGLLRVIVKDSSGRVSAERLRSSLPMFTLEA